MKDLWRRAAKQYPNEPSLMNISLMQKIREVLLQVFLDGRIVKYRSVGIDIAGCKVVGQLLGEVSPNEAYLI